MRVSDFGAAEREMQLPKSPIEIPFPRTHLILQWASQQAKWAAEDLLRNWVAKQLGLHWAAIGLRLAAQLHIANSPLTRSQCATGPQRSTSSSASSQIFLGEITKKLKAGLTSSNNKLKSI